MEWQPIETAPEGEDILVCGGKWQGEVNYEESPYSVAHVRKWYAGYFVVENTDCYTATINKPTHWQPLPSPPEQASERST